MTDEQRYLGIDGSGGGWLVAELLTTKNSSPSLMFHWHEKLDAIRAATSGCEWFIDMPIGLITDSSARPCDTALRRLLGKRSCTVFNPPVRPVLDAEDYAEANRLSREACGKGLSVQTWNIVPSIRAVDILLRTHPKRQRYTHEAHPEHLFALAAGTPLSSKHTNEGIRERKEVLERLWTSAVETEAPIHIDTALLSDARIDDVLDATILAFASWQSSDNKATLPRKPMRDEHNLRCCYSHPSSWRKTR